MGGKGVISFIRENCKEKGIHKKTISDYKNKWLIMATDGFQILYKFILAIMKNTLKSDKDYFLDKDGNTTMHIYTMLITVSNCLSNGIILFNVFDGDSPSVKKDTVSKRKTKCKTAIKECKEIREHIEENDLVKDENEDLFKKLYKFEKQSFFITKNMIDECCDILSLIGLPNLIAPEEAEAQTSVIARCKDLNVYGTIGEDSDHLTFKTPILIKNFSKNKLIEEFHLNEILEELKISYDNFIDLCIFSGNDYCNQIKGVGIKTAYQIMKELKENKTLYEVDFENDKELITGLDNIDNNYFKKGRILENKGKTLFLRMIKYILINRKTKISSDYINNFLEGKDYYLRTSKIKDPASLSSAWIKEPQYDTLKYILIEKYNFDPQFVLNFIKIVRTARKQYLNFKKTGKIKRTLNFKKRSYSYNNSSLWIKN